ncbi:sensor histidine kinase [Pseudoalteromonas denitrificans]|uniref:Histidine kinase n=1 Tax=Pseudoalteromonas denitrificans DSM 6059 TaxID=1123010 RepID=A0A1I1RZI2_9GAMM|nr:histidine kinase [Pseudoalteromonas denitrificans]SFD39724.1 Histidine kinase [Pseudoalteromonas denitrificans DSM 6059]
MSKILRQYKSFIIVQSLQIILLTLIYLDIQLSPFSLTPENLNSFLHNLALLILLPLICIYIPLKYIQLKKHTNKTIYLSAIFCAFVTGFGSATYTHTVSVPGTFLLQISTSDTMNEDKRTSVSIGFQSPGPNSGYDKPTGIGIYLAEAFVHSLFYCLWALSFLQFTSFAYKKLLVKELKKQQLDILTYQLNPHFLFNALNSIRGMLYEDKIEAKKLLQEFRALFHHHFENKQHQLDLQQEIELCKHYLKLEKVRFEERLELQWQVDQKALNAKIPSMSLFTFIENAIKHGIAPLIHGGCINIRARIYRGKLTLEVINPIKIGASADGTKTGLTNLQKRLDLIYDKNYKLKFGLTSDDNYHVSLVIPYNFDKTKLQNA